MFNKMKILVTGATGFIGNQLMSFLTKEGHSLHGLSLHSSEIKNISNIPLSDYDKLNSHFMENEYDIVIHLAAQIENIDPFQMYNANCKNTINLLEISKEHNIKKFIFTSSHAVYGESHNLPIIEDHKVSPTTIYGKSKLIAEEICKMYNQYYGLNVLILRLSSLFGEQQPTKYLIPRLIQSALQNNTVTLHKYSNGFQQMDLINILDVCNAIDLCCKSKMNFGIFNIASGNKVTVEDIVNILSKILGELDIKIQKLNYKTNHYVYNISKAKSFLGFNIKYPLNEQTLIPIVNELKKTDII